MTPKIKLDLDALAVESFATSAGETRRGTVHGHVSDTTCHQIICDCGPTNNDLCTREYSCEGSCDASCGGTCYEDTCDPHCTTGPVIVCSCSPTPQPTQQITCVGC